MLNPFLLQDKSILVTGASSGIGRATAILCSELGAKVTLIGRDKNQLVNTLSLMEGDTHVFFVMDLADENSIDQVVDALPSIDGIAGCAGIAGMNPFQFIESAELHSIFDTNFFGPVLLVNKLLRLKKLAKCGSVVFVSSIDGPKIVHLGNSSYSASKSALVGMARGMAMDLASKNIRVNCVLPGATDTPMIRTDNVTEEMLIENARQLPLKRFAQPNDIANAIVFLLSDAAKYITGSELVVDGGSSIVK